MILQAQICRIGFVLSCLGGGLTAGCGGSVSAPTTPDGSKITLVMLFRNEIEGNLDEVKTREQSTLNAHLNEDLDRRLTEGGYETTEIENTIQFLPTTRRYLLISALEEYQSNELYSRDETHLGKGVTTIAASVELFRDNNAAPILKRYERTVCTRNWTYCVGELNRNMARAVSKRINELY